jgi:hypothetical protein
MASSFLKFGDNIVLYCVDAGPRILPGDPNQSDHRPTGVYQGFVSGLGFTDDGVYVQLERKEYTPSASPIEGIDTMANVRNFSNFVFQITPKLSSEAHDDYEKNLKYYKELLRNASFMRKENEKYKTMKR